MATCAAMASPTNTGLKLRLLPFTLVSAVCLAGYGRLRAEVARAASQPALPRFHPAWLGAHVTALLILGAIARAGLPVGADGRGAVELRLFGVSVKCLSLEQLIRAKRATGRPKDLEALAELEALREESGI